MGNPNRKLLEIFKRLHLCSGPAFKLPYVSEGSLAEDLNSLTQISNSQTAFSDGLFWLGKLNQKPEGTRYTLSQDGQGK